MVVTREERDRILSMVAARQLSAEEAGQLFDTLVEEPVQSPPKPQNRTIRIWISDMTTRHRKVNMTATLPVSALRISLRVLGGLVPQLRDGRAEEIVSALENSVTGRVIDLQDLEDGKRIEVFIEQ
jgi:hypothetical protein